jgi:hypothetical protein
MSSSIRDDVFVKKTALITIFVGHSSQCVLRGAAGLWRVGDQHEL